MRTIILLILALVGIADADQELNVFRYTFIDQKTGQTIKMWSISGTFAENSKSDFPEGSFTWGNNGRINYTSNGDTAIIFGRTFYKGMPPCVYFKWDITINAPGYHSKNISDRTYACREYFGSYYSILSVETQIFLEPLKSDVDLEGELQIKQSEKNILSAEEIAKELGISEKDIIDLILQEKLPGKKIGEKYFVNRKDFEEYISKK